MSDVFPQGNTSSVEHETNVTESFCFRVGENEHHENIRMPLNTKISVARAPTR